MDRLKGKVAVITGGASGIGMGAVERFAAEGARVLVGDIDEAAGLALAARYGGEVAFQRCDVTEEADIAALMDAASARFGGLDVVFNNAGAGGARETLSEMTGEAWDRTQALLLRSVALGIRYAIPHLKRRGGGSIINTASIAGMQAGAGPIAYSTMKAAVIHLTRLAAAELGRDRIRVNAICPGLILTNIFTPGVPSGFADMVKAEMRQGAPEAQPIPQARRARRHRRGGAVLRLRRVGVRHRRPHAGRRRHVHRAAPGVGSGAARPAPARTRGAARRLAR